MENHIDMCDREEEIFYNFLLIAKLEDAHNEIIESGNLSEIYDEAGVRYTGNEKFIGGFIYRDRYPIYRVANFRGRIAYLPIDFKSVYFQEATDILLA